MRKLKNEELDRKNIAEFKAAKKLPLILLLDNVRSLNNIGSIFRTADAFLIQKIYLCGITAKPPHKDIHKTALGATESVAWEYVEDAVVVVKKLKEENVNVYAIEQAEQALQLHTFEICNQQTYAFVFGNEVKGVQQEVINHCHSVLEIPQLGTKHSLNIAVSVGVCLWDFVSKYKPF